MTTTRAFPVPEGLRLIATDLDGTLIPHGSTISARTMAALDAAAANGIHVVYVTGRPPRWLQPVIDVTDHTGYAIGANGSVVMDLAAGTTEVVAAIPAASVLRIAEELRAAVPDVVFGIETVDDIRVESGFHAARGRPPAEGLVPKRPAALPQASTVAELLDDEPIIKMIAISPDSTPDQLLAVGRETVGDLVSTTHSSTGTALIELGPPGITKASTLEQLARHLDVRADEVISFGDMPNDLAMLQWSGVSYAMTGGHPAALAAADHVAPPAADDGVAQVLEPHLAAVDRSAGVAGSN